MNSRSKKINKNKTADKPIVSQTFGVIHQGPLPDPVSLEKYKDADPSFPERIMKMAEQHNAADVKLKNRISLSNLIVPVIGQILTFLLGSGGILAGIYLARLGLSAGAIAVIIGGFSPIVIDAFKGFRKDNSK